MKRDFLLLVFRWRSSSSSSRRNFDRRGGKCEQQQAAKARAAERRRRRRQLRQRRWRLSSSFPSLLSLSFFFPFSLLQNQTKLTKTKLPRSFTKNTHTEKPDSSQLQGEIGIEGTVIEAPVAGTPPLERLKLKYYSLLVAYHQHKGDYLEVCRCLRAAYDTPAVFSPKKKEEMTDEEAAVAASLMDVEGEAAAAAASTSSTAPSTVSEDDAALAESLLKQACWYAVLAPATSSDQRTLLEATAAEPALDAFPLYRKLLATFSGNEVVEWPAFEEMVSAEIRGPRAADVFAVSTEQGKARLEALQTRVTEHNVLSASRFYSRITLARLARLLGFFGANGAGEAEAHVARMVSDGAVRARIDRPAGVVKFLGPVGGGGGGIGGVAGAAPAAAAGVPISFAPDSPEDLLNDWAGGIKGLLDVVERASASIAREAALHKVTLRGVV